MGDVVFLKLAGSGPEATEPKGAGARAALIRYTEETFDIGPEKSAAFVDHLLTHLFVGGFIVVQAPEED